MPIVDESVYATLSQATRLTGPPPDLKEIEQKSELDFNVAYEVLILVSQGRLSCGRVAFEKALAALPAAKACSLLQACRMSLPVRHAVKRCVLPTAPGTFNVRNAVVTPKYTVVKPCERSVGSRVLREAFPLPVADPAEYLLRVSFRLEEGGRPQLDEKAASHARRVMNEGLTLAGHHYQFFTYTARQLDTGSAWFIRTDAPARPEDILAGLGKFELIRSPGKLAARVQLCFSDTYVGYCEDYEWLNVEDIRSKKGCFTDGAGTISTSLLTAIARRLELDPVPSAIQVRVGGSKGMLVHDPSLPGLTICTRHSMQKFVSTHRTIEVCAGGWSVFKPGNLNRQTIAVLSSRGVPDEAFYALHDQLVMRVRQLMEAPNPSTYRGAMRETIAACEWLQPQQVVLDMLRGGVDPKAEMLLAGMLLSLYAAHWERIKASGRILVERACTLFGVPSTSVSALKEGQVFLWPSLPHDNFKYPAPITGRVIVIKNPALHPGDVLVLEAVDSPSLRHLRNVLVFPVQGSRPHAADTSGGDLDGDEYSIFWEPLLFRSIGDAEPSRAYEEQREQRASLFAEKPVDQDAQIEFFATHALKNDLARISNSHLIWADKDDLSTVGGSDLIRDGQKGVWRDECIELAKQASLAVDFIKSGVPAKMEPSLMIDSAEFPDFKTAGRKTPGKPSPGIVGKLYRKACEQFDMAATSGHVPTEPYHLAKFDQPGFKKFLEEA